MTNQTHPIPNTISAEAQAVLAATAANPIAPNPTADDDAGWAALGEFAASTDPGMVEALARATTGAVDSDITVTIEAHETDGARYFNAVPDGLADNDDRVLLCIHGGGFTFGGGATARRSTELIAGNYGIRTWGVDYRELPDNPFPAGLDDVMAVYKHLLTMHSPDSIAIVGQSGGANLSAALLLRARDEGLPFPAVVGLISPPADLTQAGDSYQTNGFTLAADGLTSMAQRYRGKYPLDHPYVSPLFGSYSSNFPPTILTAGTRDFLLSDTVRLHRKLLRAGVVAELHIWEGAPHGLFMGQAPEDREQVAQVRRFFEKAWLSVVGHDVVDAGRE